MAQRSIPGSETLTLVGTTGGVALIPLPTPLSRLNYFDGKFLRAADLVAEQTYLQSLVQLSNQAGGSGVVHGFDTTLGSRGDALMLGAGLAIDPAGRVLLLPTEQTINIPELLDRSRRQAIDLIRRPEAIVSRRSQFGDCVLVTGTSDAEPVRGRDLWLITLSHAEALCGEEDVYGKLCEDACVTSSDRPRRVEGILVRALPLDVRPLPTSSAVALNRTHLRSQVASAYFADERERVANLISKAGLESETWCLGALPQGGTDVPIAVIARAGSTTIFLDAWIARRERIDTPPRRYWAWRMAMRPWDVFLAQVLQFQCQLHELLHDTPDPGSDDHPCSDQRDALDVATRYLNDVRGAYLRHLEAIRPVTGVRAATAIDDDLRSRLFTLPGGVAAIADLQSKLAATVQRIFAGPRDRVLINGGIIELPSAGYLPVVPDSAVSVNAQVERLLGNGVDLRFCIVRPDFVAHALESAQHMERISLIQGLDDPTQRPEVDILVPDGEFVEERPQSLGAGWEVFVTAPEMSVPDATVGNIRGTVMDAAGGSHPGAAVSLSNSQLNVDRATTTNAKSQYTFADLPAGGGYSITMSHPDFASETKANLTVEDGKTLEVDFILTPAARPRPSAIAVVAGAREITLARAAISNARPVLHGAGRSERLSTGGGAFHFAGVAETPGEHPMFRVARALIAVEEAGEIGRILQDTASGRASNTFTRPSATSIPLSPLESDPAFLRRLRTVSDMARRAASSRRSEATGFAVRAPGAAAVAGARAARAATVSAMWATMEVTENPWLMPDGARTPASFRFTITNAGEAPRYVDYTFNGYLLIEQPAPATGVRNAVARLHGNAIVRFVDDAGQPVTRATPFDRPVILSLGTAANGSATAEIAFPLVEGLRLVLATEWASQPVQAKVFLRLDSAAGRSEQTIALLRANPAVLSPDNVVHEASTSAIAIIDAALAEREPDFDARATALLFPPPRAPRPAVTVRARHDWVLFHRRRVKRCGPAAAVPAPPLPPARFTVYHALVANEREAATLRDLLLRGVDRNQLSAFKEIDTVEFAPSTSTLMTPRDAMLEDWAGVTHGDQLLYSAIAVRGTIPGEETLAVSRLRRVDAALASLMSPTPATLEERLEDVPAMLATSGADGIIAMISMTRVTLECHEVFAALPVLTRVTTPTRLGVVSFAGGTESIVNNSSQAVEEAWKKAGSPKLKTVTVMVPAATRNPARDLRVRQAKVIVGLLDPTSAAEVVVEKPDPWTSECEAMTVLEIVPPEVRTDCHEVFLTDRENLQPVRRAIMDGSFRRDMRGVVELGTVRFKQNDTQVDVPTLDAVIDRWRRTGGQPVFTSLEFMPAGVDAQIIALRTKQGDQVVREMQASRSPDPQLVERLVSNCEAILLVAVPILDR